MRNLSRICRDGRLHSCQFILSHTANDSAHIIVDLRCCIAIIPVDLGTQHIGAALNLLLRRELCHAIADVFTQLAVRTLVLGHCLAVILHINAVHFTGGQFKADLCILPGQRKSLRKILLLQQFKFIAK